MVESLIVSCRPAPDDNIARRIVGIARSCSVFRGSTWEINWWRSERSWEDRHDQIRIDGYFESKGGGLMGPWRRKESLEMRVEAEAARPPGSLVGGASQPILREGPISLSQPFFTFSPEIRLTSRRFYQGPWSASITLLIDTVIHAFLRAACVWT